MNMKSGNHVNSGWPTALGGLAIACALSAPAAAQDWPDEELVVSVVVPYSAGGGTDSAVRPLIEELRNHLPARIQINNIGGAASSQGTNEVLNLPADGYTLLVSGTHTIGATMQGLTDGYHALDQVVALNWDPFIIAVLENRPYDTMEQLVDAAKEKPGSICLGNAGMGGATGVASVAINLAFDGVFNVTPFDGGQNLRTDVLGGRCEAGIFSQSEILSNRADLRPLVILTEEHSRLEGLADVPNLVEAGYETLDVPGGSFRSIAVRKGTPEEVQQIIADAFEAAFSSEAYTAFMDEQGIIPTFSKGAEAAAYFDALVEGYEPIVRASGLYRDK
ncbi:MAG: Bug family tripartite tricarboxylate transporter substrate binding protein [Tropicimonas sp.]|uniref:Bug family tripartite tricarboxylate transporter substrate binding protein n=1 Tax=Tropicimonas sp. TaxID=2067044 RepID=UPI003A861848